MRVPWQAASGCREIASTSETYYPNFVFLVLLNLRALLSDRGKCFEILPDRFPARLAVLEIND